MTTRDVALSANDLPPGLVASLLESAQSQKNNAKQPSKEEQLRDAISMMLSRLGGLTVQEDSLRFEGSAFILPAQYEGKVRSAIDFLENWLHQQEQPHVISRKMNFRPLDGAHAFMETMREITGTTGFGVTKMTMFGPKHPEFRTINVGPTRTTQVPWGAVRFPSYEAEFTVGEDWDPERGTVFSLHCKAPRKYRRHIEAIYTMVEKYLRENSIYRGKAITGAMEPEFLDLSKVNRDEVVYSAKVLDQLTANVWVPLRHTERLRTMGKKLKRAILLAGPYGTGKTLAAMLTALEADANGWTFLLCRTGKDDPSVVLQTAQLYSPAVVIIEDVDVHTEGGSSVDISRMLEMLDGMGNKGAEVITLFTTNHLKRIQKGALRPGRIDAVIEIDGLDTAGFRKLVTYTLGAEHLDPEVDWDTVAEAFKGFLPAFVVEATNRTLWYAMGRNEGAPGVMTTQDLVAAADSLRPQLDLHDEAKEGANRVTFEDLLRGSVENVVARMTNERIGGFEVEEATILNGAKN